MTSQRPVRASSLSLLPRSLLEPPARSRLRIAVHGTVGSVAKPAPRERRRASCLPSSDGELGAWPALAVVTAPPAPPRHPRAILGLPVQGARGCSRPGVVR